MTIKQVSIFIANKGGSLIKVLDMLSKADVQIVALTIADTIGYGICRIICDDPSRAYLKLKEEGINVQLTDVNAIYVEDKSGEAARALKIISDAGVGINYMYSFPLKDKGVIVFRTSDSVKTNEIISLNKLNSVMEGDFKKG